MHKTLHIHGENNGRTTRKQGDDEAKTTQRPRNCGLPLLKYVPEPGGNSTVAGHYCIEQMPFKGRCTGEQ